MMKHRKLFAAFAALTLPLALVACGDDSDAESATTAPGDAAGAETPATEAEDGESGDVIEVTMVDFAFEGLPATAPAGSRLTVVNAAPDELHEVVVFRLPDDEDRAVSELAQLPPDELTSTLGEPHSVLLAAPGGPEISAVGDGVLSEPGRYALFCFIPTGADAEEYLTAAATSEGAPEVDGGAPHFVHGMYAEITIEE